MQRPVVCAACAQVAAERSMQRRVSRRVETLVEEGLKTLPRLPSAPLQGPGPHIEPLCDYMHVRGGGRGHA
jgi:hypothetical protein